MSLERKRRSDIEGLRALAVLLVVAYHFRIGPFTGGFIGVDVFFVISGFLITKLLIDEADRDKRIQLSDFWARRIRRIIPMSLLVVVVTVIAGLYMLEPGRARELATVALGAIGFSANFVLYFTTDTYLSGVTPPSPLQHYWSLAIEEQFYLVWPLILFAVVKFGRAYWKAWLAGLILILGGASLAFGIVTTPTNPGAGYYFPHARIWEILAGSALALFAVPIFRLPTWLRAIFGWIGLGAIIWSAVSFNSETIFPGSAALVPVLGTVAVLAAFETSWGPQTALSIAPAQHIGAWSYSLYLWHWPILILIEARFGTPSGFVKFWLVVAAVLLSAATYTFVEQPTRKHQWLVARTRRSLTAGALAIAAGLSAGVAVFAIAPKLDARYETLATTEVPSEEPTSENSVQSSIDVSKSSLPTVTGAPNDVNVLLLGDSTMAGLRWYEQGAVALSGFNYILDAESCRKIADMPCLGREFRTPKTAVRALEEFDGPLDYVVLIVGYDSSVNRLNDELKRIITMAQTKNVKLIYFDFKESLEFPAPGSRGKRSVYADFNEILRDVVAADDTGNLVLASWNSFSSGRSSWFRRDGIHLSVEGSVALGWFISHVVANVADQPCPFSEIYPCAIPATMDPELDLMDSFNVVATKTRCYEDGEQRKRVCTQVDR